MNVEKAKWNRRKTNQTRANTNYNSDAWPSPLTLLGIFLTWFLFILCLFSVAYVFCTHFSTLVPFSTPSAEGTRVRINVHTYCMLVDWFAFSKKTLSSNVILSVCKCACVFVRPIHISRKLSFESTTGVCEKNARKIHLKHICGSTCVSALPTFLCNV